MLMAINILRWGQLASVQMVGHGSAEATATLEGASRRSQRRVSDTTLGQRGQPGAWQRRLVGQAWE